MTPMGHSLVGAAIAAVVVPSEWRPWAKTTVAFVFVILANVPDFQLPCWGHRRYDISHSIFVNCAFVLTFSLLLFLSPRIREIKGAAWILLGAVSAWLSHLLLDTFYNHGKGLAMFWPFSTARLSLAIPWFETLRMPFHFDAHSARVLLIELLSFGLLVVLALVGRFARGRRRVSRSQR